jgi:hypothetical protein
MPSIETEPGGDENSLQKFSFTCAIAGEVANIAQAEIAVETATSRSIPLFMTSSSLFE